MTFFDGTNYNSLPENIQSMPTPEEAAFNISARRINESPFWGSIGANIRHRHKPFGYGMDRREWNRMKKEGGMENSILSYLDGEQLDIFDSWKSGDISREEAIDSLAESLGYGFDDKIEDYPEDMRAIHKARAEVLQASREDKWQEGREKAEEYMRLEENLTRKGTGFSKFRKRMLAHEKNFQQLQNMAFAKGYGVKAFGGNFVAEMIRPWNFASLWIGTGFIGAGKSALRVGARVGATEAVLGAVGEGISHDLDRNRQDIAGIELDPYGYEKAMAMGAGFGAGFGFLVGAGGTALSNRVFRNRQRIAEAEKTTELTEQEAALKALQRDSGVMRRASKPVSKAIDRVGDRIDRLRGRAGRREKFDIREATEQLELDRKDLAERAYAGEFAEEVESAKDLAKGIDIEKNLLPTAKLMKKASEEPPLITSQRARVEREVAEQDRLMSPHRLALPESLEEVVVPQTEEVADEISDALRDNLTTDYALQPDTPFTLNGVNINLNDPLATSPFLVSPEALVKTTQIQPDFSLSSKTLTPAEEKAYKGIMSPSPNGGAYTLTFHGGDISNKTRIQPRVWQHKESDPITGVVKKGGIKTTKKFNSNAADVAMGYLWKNGRLDIVDGHQRRNQFIKFVEEGQKGVFLRVEVFREADGITPETMRNLAAEKNTIQERGTVMDMARYIRSRPVGQRQAIFESMPTEMEGKSGRARGLASLEDEPFNWVARGDYPHEARAAMVGLKVIGEPEQMEAMKQLLRWKYPLGSVEAIGDAIDTIVLSFEGRRVEQGTMFASVGVDSLIQEMSFVITKFKKMARGDKKLMRLVADNAESIEERAVASKIDIDKSRYVSHEQETG